SRRASGSGSESAALVLLLVGAALRAVHRSPGGLACGPLPEGTPVTGGRRLSRGSRRAPAAEGRVELCSLGRLRLLGTRGGRGLHLAALVAHLHLARGVG